MNQGAALVHIYTDGSVLVSHGGVEVCVKTYTLVTEADSFQMGQGLYTKYSVNYLKK